MVLVLALDSSPSLDRSLPDDASVLGKDILQLGVLHLLQLLERSVPNERMKLLNIASDAIVLQSFTTDHALLRTSLYNLKTSEVCSLETAIKAAIKELDSRHSTVSSLSHIVLIADASKSTLTEDIVSFIPSHARLHVFLLGAPEPALVENVENVCRKCGGNVYVVPLSDSRDAVKKFKAHANSFVGLHCILVSRVYLHDRLPACI
eukprot:GILJ01009416.1.p1 GENE.GILJ01009416.1~~GILJ01009416.1.p1  ORF type:complete len:206 (-),score=15.36 GILJ01009416.1:93-710(-)